MRLMAAFESKFDQALLTSVSSVSASITLAVAGLVAAGLTLYIMFLAYAIARGDVQEPMSKITKEITAMTLIAVIATSVGVYQTYIVGAANGVLGLLTQAVTQSDAKTVGETLDFLWFDEVSINANGEKVPMQTALWIIAQTYSTLGIPDYTYSIAAVFVWLAICILCVFCFLPIVLAKVGMSLMLAIGPLFIYLAMIPQTRNYFASWLSNMLGNLMTLVLVALICSTTVNIFRLEVQEQLQSLDYKTSQPIAIAIALFVISIVMGFASLHVSQIGAQLAGGGLALDTKGLAGTVVQSMMLKKKDSSTPPDAPNSMQNSGLSAASYSAGKKLGEIISSNRNKG